MYDVSLSEPSAKLKNSKNLLSKSLKTISLVIRGLRIMIFYRLFALSQSISGILIRSTVLKSTHRDASFGNRGDINQSFFFSSKYSIYSAHLKCKIKLVPPLMHP